MILHNKLSLGYLLLLILNYVMGDLPPDSSSSLCSLFDKEGRGRGGCAALIECEKTGP